MHCYHSTTGLGAMPSAGALSGIPTVPHGPGPSPPMPTEMGPSGSPGMQPGASNAALVTNLLPLSTTEPAATLNGVYVGEGLPPVPAKLAEKIRKWEYVEMAELLPEFWNSPKEESSETRRRSPRWARQVTDIHTYGCSALPLTQECWPGGIRRQSQSSWLI